MKNTIILILTALFISCGTSQNITQTTLVKSKKEEPKIIKKEIKKVVKAITAKKDTNGYLVGVANKDSFSDEAFKGWFNSRYEEYTTDKETIGKLTEAIKGYTIKGFMGTWCGDSKRETPRFYKILEETGFDENDFELVTVNRSKRTPDNLQQGFNIIRVPTYIFYKDGREIGRYVEYPRETLEKDILKIVSGQPYKHSYDKSK